ncbi:hypothetical protein FPQ18DRAFT_389428 [Pyronema domesticum]|nr:hypothetical protein FPQ18DRAFT_389428 [Pyronema domesticum]
MSLVVGGTEVIREIGDEEEENENEEEWEEDEELIGAEAAPVIPEEALEAAGRWLFSVFGGKNGDL